MWSAISNHIALPTHSAKHWPARCLLPLVEQGGSQAMAGFPAEITGGVDTREHGHVAAAVELGGAPVGRRVLRRRQVRLPAVAGMAGVVGESGARRGGGRRLLRGGACPAPRGCRRHSSGGEPPEPPDAPHRRIRPGDRRGQHRASLAGPPQPTHSTSHPPASHPSNDTDTTTATSPTATNNMRVIV